ncbi:transcription factor MYB119-like [Olea europaea subsp. europaea]|uniref:Transcription factor MYB119-like n=1 Tax=Olea europaea subsp. europaea TaxID=158383 RepID=A0A8S0S4U3_OLEEU|nr:transcription factor MYB119-like [Olea europaea subsp. europaea]
MEGLQHEKQTLGENILVNVIPALVNPNRKEKRENSSSARYQIKDQWIGEEDGRLISLVHQLGLRKWAIIAEEMVGRVGKLCRARWNNHLHPHIKKDVLTDDEERRLIQAHERLGNRWAEIANIQIMVPPPLTQILAPPPLQQIHPTPVHHSLVMTTIPFFSLKSCNKEMDFLETLFENNQSIDSIPVDHCQPMNPAEGTSENTYSFNIDEIIIIPPFSSLS